jgi:hypothetical protein
MPENKTIEVNVGGARTSQAKSDLSSFAQWAKGLGRDVGKVWGNVKFGDLGRGAGGFSKLLKEFDSFDKSLKKTGDSLTGLWKSFSTGGKTLEDERRKLQDFRRELEQTQKLLGEAEAKVARTKKFGLGGSALTDAENEFGAAAKRHGELSAQVESQEALVEQVTKGNLGKTLLGGAAIGLIATAVIKAVDAMPGVLDNRNQFSMQTQARAGSIEGGLKLRAGQRDFSDLVALQGVYGDREASDNLADLSDSNSWRRHYMRTKAALDPNTTVKWWEVFGSFEGKEGERYRKAMTAEETQKFIDSAKARDPESVLAMRQYSGNSQGYLQFMRSMGMNEGGMSDYVRRTREATGGAFGIDSIMQAGLGIGRAGAGRSAGANLAGGALQVVISGMDQGVVTQIAGSLAGGGQADAMLRHLRSVSGSSMDAFAAERAGQFVGQNYLTGNGFNSGAGLMRFMTSGFNNDAQDAARVGYREQGLQGFNAILGQGGDAYQQTMATLNALRITRGTNVDLFGVDRLANANAQDVFNDMDPNSKVSRYDAAFGIKKGMFTKEAMGQTNSLMVRNLAATNSPAGTLAKRIISGKNSLSDMVFNGQGDFSGLGDDTDPRAALAALLSKINPKFGSPQAAEEFIIGAQSAQRGEKLQDTNKKDAGADSLARKMDQRAFDQEWSLFVKAQTNLRGALDILADTIRTVSDQAKAAASAGTAPGYGMGKAGPAHSNGVTVGHFE